MHSGIHFALIFCKCWPLKCNQKPIQKIIDFFIVFDHHFNTILGTLLGTQIVKNEGTLNEGGCLFYRLRVRCAPGHPQTPKMYQKGRHVEPFGVPLAPKILKNQLFWKPLAPKPRQKSNQDIEGDLLPFQLAKPNPKACSCKARHEKSRSQQGQNGLVGVTR